MNDERMGRIQHIIDLEEATVARALAVEEGRPTRYPCGRAYDRNIPSSLKLTAYMQACGHAYVLSIAPTVFEVLPCLRQG